MLFSRLSHGLHVLTGGRCDLPAHQQTLRETIKWSYDLLGVSEQRLFRQLSVFVGGCSLEAIEALAFSLGDDPIGVLDGISSLLDKNMIKSSEQEMGGSRLFLLKTIRAFGLECLQERGELLQAQQAHMQYYLTWTETACKALFGPEQLSWGFSFMQEMNNLRTVIRFMLY